MERLFGPNLVNHYRYGTFAVHKDLQGKGIGRLMHHRNVQEVSQGMGYVHETTAEL